MLRVAFWEAEDGLSIGTSAWGRLTSRVAAVSPDLLLTNELPFGPWLPSDDVFDEGIAARCIDLHDKGVVALARLKAGSVVTTRPRWSGSKLTNEAVLIKDGLVSPLHEKQYFPQEKDYYERTWFASSKVSFDVHRVNDIGVACLLCTELMFNEWARRYRHLGAHLLLVPRCSGNGIERWKTAASMAAIVSGCYVVSSNRRATGRPAGDFGGCGFAFEPGGRLICETSPNDPVSFVDVDLESVASAQRQYPCDVDELTFSTSEAAHRFLDDLCAARVGLDQCLSQQTLDDSR